MEEIIVRLIKMPYAVGGVTVVDENGDYNVYLNSLRGDQSQVCQHEMDHIKNGDFYNSKPIFDIERDSLRIKKLIREII